MMLHKRYSVLWQIDPTLKTLERIAELTNSTLVIDLIPNELEQVVLARAIQDMTAERICRAMSTVKLDTVYFLKGKEGEA